jgi:hypothetical protein
VLLVKKLTEKTLLKGRIDEIGRLLLTLEQMKELRFVEGETVFLDLSDSYIIIAKELGYSLAYDQVKVMANGVYVGRDICRSKLFMTEDRKILCNTTAKVEYTVQIERADRLWLCTSTAGIGRAFRLN